MLGISKMRFMLTPNQEKYLQKIPESEKVLIKPFDSRATDVAADLLGEIKRIVPDFKVLFMGAAALGIAGQNDLDLYILCTEKDFAKYLPKLEQHFGPKIQGISIIKWEFTRDGFPVELYLTDPETPSMKEQIQLFELLKSSPNLRKEYEQIKLDSDGISFREYMRRKYDFFNRILGLNNGG